MKIIRNMAAGLVLAGSAYLLAAPAQADDHSWSGLYAGFNGGWIGKNYDWAFNPAIPGAPNQAYSLSGDAGIVGGHIGIQHQFQQFVAGVEVSYSGIPGHDWSTRARYGVGSANSLASLDGIFTVGGRLGYALNHSWLLFATGGYASATVKTAGRTVGTGNLFQETSRRQDGWYLGGGVEYAVTRNIILGVEYQRLDFGTDYHCVDNCTPGNTNHHDISATADVVRARVSFKLGRPEEHYEESMK